MKEAGLTNGAFYAHFASKEALVAAVIYEQLLAQLELFRQELGGIEGLKRITDIYLSAEHIGSCATGCPSAALIGEISKRTTSTREVYTSGLQMMTGELLSSTGLSDGNSKQAILALFALLIGTVQLARTVTDDALVSDIIKGGHAAAYDLLDVSFGSYATSLSK